MRPIKFLESQIVKDFCQAQEIKAEFIPPHEILEENSQNLGTLIYIDVEFLQKNLSWIFDSSRTMQFVVINEQGQEVSMMGAEGLAVEDLFVRSGFAEQAAITYVHELNNHLAIICGRLYEFKKIHKTMDPGEMADKFEQKLTSMNEKVDQVTDISRLITRKSIKAIIPTTDEQVSLKEVVSNITRDYRKVLEKTKNKIVNEAKDCDKVGIEQSIFVENIIIAIALKLACLTSPEGKGSSTTISSQLEGTGIQLTFVLEGELVESVQEYFYHRSWMNFLNHSVKNNCEIDIFEGKNKIHLEVKIPI